MKQVALNPRSGVLGVTDVPVPRVRPGTVLVHNAASAVSAGTERGVIDLAGRSLLGKARARPDLVREALGKVRRDGLRTTIREGFLRLERPQPLGYSSAGTVLDVGQGVEGLRAGDRVACAGAGWASHAEVVVVPRQLCVPLPTGVSFEVGAFAMLGAIALHGIRRAGVGVGDVVAVLGLGILGQLTVQLLRGAGCRVLAYDVDAGRVALAQRLGADASAAAEDEARRAALRLSGDLGADAVIVTAATSSNAPLDLAAEISRVRGTVVMVGVAGMRVPRRPFWKKELALLLARASGPGGEEDAYERKGIDYPAGYVRWTAGRNMACFLDEVARGTVRVEPLVTHRFPIERAEEAYALIRGRGREAHLGVVLTYPESPVLGRTMVLRPARSAGVLPGEGPGAGRAAAAGVRPVPVAVGVIGAGLFAHTVLLPALRRLPGIRLLGLATSSGVSARHAAERLGFQWCTTDYRKVLEDPEVQAVLIATRHDLHAQIASEALRAGKHVFVEKPLALTPGDVRAVLAARAASGRVLVVGFNRRYSPLAGAVRAFLAGERPLVLVYRVNAGEVPADHWVYDSAEGGGRWLGEGGHFVDLVQYLADADPIQVFARSAMPEGAAGPSLLISLALGDGSAATIVYADGSDRAASRERLEVFGRGCAATLEDFRGATLVRGGRVRRIRRWEAERGHREELLAWLAAARGEAPAAVGAATYAANAACCFAVLESVRSGAAVRVDAEALMPPPQRVEPERGAPPGEADGAR
jgi:predicted dehydrogenase/threonine dehydrogenase-like Zn-dependent dehydrogenase